MQEGARQIFFLIASLSAQLAVAAVGVFKTIVIAGESTLPPVVTDELQH